MPVVIDHQVIPARDQEQSAAFFARIMGLEWAPGRGHYAPVRLSDCARLRDARVHAAAALRVSGDGA